MIPAIKIENLSKQYRLGQVCTGTLSHSLSRFFGNTSASSVYHLKRWWSRCIGIRGKEDPYLKIGEGYDRSTKGSSDYV
jgi:lipopolysaccharide transport system ATP-binding protein